MSQYRQDGGGGSTAVPGAAGQGPTSAGAGPNGASDGETETSGGSGPAGVPSDSNAYPTESPPTATPPDSGHGYASFPYSSSGPDHAFGPRQPFGGPKQLPPPHRFVPGPPLSQPSGPTPTLNQLLQSNSPVPHRYQNNYTHPEQHYNQWSQKHPQGYGPGPAPPPGPYRTQQTLSPAYGGGPGSAPSPGGYDSRTSWPGGPPPSGAPQHSQHGPGSPGQPQPQSQQPSQTQNQPPTSQPQQNSSNSVPVSQPSPQPSQPPISHSPGPGPGPGGQMPPSPQQHNQQHQGPGHQQGFPSRPPPPISHSPGPGPSPGPQMPPSPQQHNQQHQGPGHQQGFPSRPPPPISHSPGPGPSPGPQMPPSPQQHNQQHQGPGHQQGFPSRPPPPTTPNAHTAEAAVFNSHVPPQDTYRSKKTDSLSKLYEMDDSPDRRAWLDKLLAFMDDRRTPITTCPTISKNPLDLFRLYMYVKDHGGFMEVTKNKTWKDIAGRLGIGASSSAAYTLRKHYTKNLLAYECQFDRGGIDPQPIINQVEASSKKKGAKATSVPSPGSSNSQDSFPPGSGGGSMDGYGGYNGYPPSGNPEYPQRPSSQSAPSPHGAYNLQKHYTKNLLAYECQFDRGGIDPQPIINQVEANNKKKGSKTTSVPSPGSSSSQDSFPPGSGGGSMDGYGGYNGYPPSGNPEYPQRPSSQSAPSPHGGSGGANHLNGATPGGPSPAGGAPDNVSVSNPFDDVSPSPSPRGGPFPGGPHPPYPTGTPPRPPGGQNYTGQPGYQYPGPGPGPNAPPDQYSPYSNTQGYPPAVRPVYPPYSGDSSGAPPGQPNSGQPPSSSAQDPYNRYNSNPAAGYSPRPPYGGAQGAGGPPTSQTSGPGAYPGHQEYYRPDQNAGAAGYSAVSTANKNMPPPGQQPPRRHPDFAKDQPYPPYGQPRQPMYGGWPNNNQYRPPQYGTPGNQVAPNQWNQGSRPGGPWPNNQGYQGSQPGQNQWQPMANQGGQATPMRPVHRPGKPFPTIMPPGGAAKGSNQQPVSNSYGHGQLPKKEITFPPDSVENVTPVLYRRKRICKSDVGPVDAWRLIMCLRSGILTESTYALDMLNILLFDDSSVGYFGLNQWPGLLDLLLEHFKRNLSDMFDGPYPREEEPEQGDVDLGAVVKPVDPSLKTVVLNKTTNYTLISRRGHPVKLVEHDDDIFVQDNLRDWDTRGDVNIANTLAEIPTDPWYTNAEHILPNFQAEFGRIPFHTRLADKKKEIKSEEVKEENERQATPPPEEAPPPKVSDKKRIRTKTLSDVISRIKKDTSEDNENVLMLETTTKLDIVKTEVVSETSLNCEESASSSVDLNISVNGECSNSMENSSETKRVRGKPIHDPAGSLKRRRLSDYEDESYSRDEASLVLLTESQDNLGKRCVCISNILRSLTFIPGNEPEFAKSISFLALIGKLLLLHHEHPPRTQKTRNYDREEDADFADSCSSLQGESEWWWDFLAHIRENILVCVANIAGQIDVSVYEEDVARPLLDGLLHWAICPSATAQDPFSSVGPTSLLSPQRLALEALCKLCVTNSNVDLVIATPPFSRLEKLCAVLTKHLCRSEDQVLREFSINLLHYLAAADSSMARVVASQTPCVSLLVAFIEQAEQSALEVANQRGISALRDNPDSMGTSLDMLRRAAATLVFLSKHPENKALMVQQESRLLALVMSQILDQQVALLISKVLFQISRS